MIRETYDIQVHPSKYRDFLEGFRRLQDVARQKGLISRGQSTLMSATVGRINRVMIVTDYDSYAQWETEGNKFMSDADCMALWRSLGDFTDGYPVSELWESAEDIA